MSPNAAASESTGRTLLAIAAPKEAWAVLRGLGAPHEESDTRIDWRARRVNERFDLVVSGVGKGNAAGAVARALDPAVHARVLSIGVAGALPGSGLSIGDVVDADRASYADEGSLNPDGFVTIAQMGFGPLADVCGPGTGLDQTGVPCEPLLQGERWGTVPFALRVGGVATVSTCSGCDALAAEVARRTGAIAEDMEAAAVGFSVARLARGVRLSALKVISNTTGDRAGQTWDLRRAFERLREVASLL